MRRLALALWVLAGLLWAFALAGMLTIGAYVVPFAGLATMGAMTWGIRLWPAGLIGVSALVGWIGWNNRHGPGDHCTSVPDGVQCTQMWNPWPWFAVAVILVGLGLLLTRRELRRPVSPR